MRVRWLMRAPIGLYRARLGFIFGTRLLLLKHVGRESGVTRFVVLEVVDHPAPNCYIVASAFGRRAQWFRNIAANPHVWVTVGSRRSKPGLARIMNEDESVRALAVYGAAHPDSWAALKPVLAQTLGEPVREDGSNVTLVSLDLR